MKDRVESGATSGRRRSGEARMKKLNAQERKDLAQKAARSRWAEAAANETVYEPEAWGDLSLAGGDPVPCAVLVVNGEVVRVVSERALIKSFGGKRGGSHWIRTKSDTAAANLPILLSAGNLRDCIPDELRGGLRERYLYKISGRGGMIAHGVRAELYPMICDVFLKARDRKLLLPSQEHLAVAADILMRGLAHTGIIALVDEATGFQEKRARDALRRILEAFIAKELQPWVRTFPAEFYEHLFRLRGLDYKIDTPKKPQYFGHLTNDIIYRRLAPGVLKELKKVVIKNDAGRPKHKLFQKLTSNTGYPKLREHLGAVVALMKVSDDYPSFKGKLDRWYAPYGDTLPLPFGDDGAEEDQNRGL